MSSAQANGNYGPGTIAATPTVNQGANSDVVQVIQYGLYVNGFYTGCFLVLGRKQRNSGGNCFLRTTMVW